MSLVTVNEPIQCWVFIISTIVKDGPRFTEYTVGNSTDWQSETVDDSGTCRIVVVLFSSCELIPTGNIDMFQDFTQPHLLGVVQGCLNRYSYPRGLMLKSID